MNQLASDKALQEIIDVDFYPTSDAIGERKSSQLDLYDPSEYRYWAVITNENLISEFLFIEKIMPNYAIISAKCCSISDLRLFK